MEVPSSALTALVLPRQSASMTTGSRWVVTSSNTLSTHAACGWSRRSKDDDALPAQGCGVDLTASAIVTRLTGLDTMRLGDILGHLIHIFLIIGDGRELYMMAMTLMDRMRVIPRGLVASRTRDHRRYGEYLRAPSIALPLAESPVLVREITSPNQ